MFQRFSDEGLAQRSYLIACDRTREAVVVDPRRDIDVFVTAAERHGLRISQAIETHTHADFVSGARELAATGAEVVAGPGAGLQFPYREASHRQQWRVGDIDLEILHTPGHTPEHISILVRESGRAVRVLTGDTLFVGAVGRPDLLGEDRARALAGQLYDSLFTTLLRLDDDVEVHPGHGAGSLCGAGIGKEPHSTIGQERRFNPFLQKATREEFVAAVLADLPDRPAYFTDMKRLNRNGPPVLNLDSGLPGIAAWSPSQAAALLSSDAVLLDLRSPEAFATGHPSGALSMTFGPRLGYWSAWILPQGVRIVLLVSDPGQIPEAARQLLRVGFDSLAGYVEGGYAAWRSAGERTSSLDLITARELRDRVERRERQIIVDVRSPREWLEGHIDEAVNIPVSDLPARAGELPRGAVVATVCESGFRSSLAASILLRAGIDVINVADGTKAYRLLENV
jgi:hydroxyacylglutathione hydrolase